MLLNYSSHCSKCGGLHNDVIISNDLDDAFERMAKAIYEGMDTDQLYAEFYLELSNSFKSQVESNYKIDFNKAEYNSPDLMTRQALVNNCFAFSGAKSFSQIQELQDLIINKKGEYKSFDEFKQAALKINQEYNKNWLKTEYNNAVNSSLSASQYQRYVKDKADYPYLIYQTAGDSNVRPEHQRLDGTKLPIDDTFWDTYYPPNDWGCRCDVIQDSSKRDITERDDALERGSGAVKNKLFKNNPGKSGIIFNEGHPYYKNVKGSMVEMKAVDNYGLRDIESIYADPNRLSKRLETFEKTEDFDEWWQSNKVVSNKFVINDNNQKIKLVAEDELKDKLLQKGDRWKYAKELPVVIQTPDEVYTLTKRFKKANYFENLSVYIKYYNDKPIIVVAEAIKDKNTIRIKSFYEVTPEKGGTLDDVRRGLLLYKK